MKTFIVVILGMATSVLIHGHWLFIDNKTWTDILIESRVFAYFAKNFHEGWSYALISSWFCMPLLLPVAIFLAFVINRLNRNRLFCYSVLATSAFVFVVLPKLPIFDIVLDVLVTYTNIIINRITPLSLFLIIFYFSTLLINKYEKPIVKSH